MCIRDSCYADAKYSACMETTDEHHSQSWQQQPQPPQQQQTSQQQQIGLPISLINQVSVWLTRAMKFLVLNRFVNKMTHFDMHFQKRESLHQISRVRPLGPYSIACVSRLSYCSGLAVPTNFLSSSRHFVFILSRFPLQMKTKAGVASTLGVDSELVNVSSPLVVDVSSLVFQSSLVIIVDVESVDLELKECNYLLIETDSDLRLPFEFGPQLLKVLSRCD
eukprot:TRINITY_DN395_c0_g1_i6.p1 TRINITY_DN395_c0_g1~~TRINITY_DN395_c0_g1_i6.p1  ORF type:complete len:245 (-),score=-11.41 TRINITY_DN395_c0_g1_i6:116-778(-)